MIAIPLSILLFIAFTESIIWFIDRTITNKHLELLMSALGRFFVIVLFVFLFLGIAFKIFEAFPLS